MTSVLVFIKPGTPGQMSVGAMITFFFLLLGLFLRPFCSSSLNTLNTGTLIAQFCTLFVGIMITLLDAMKSGSAQGGGDESLDRAIMAFMVVTVNGVALAWPFVHKVLSGKLADYYDMTMDVYYWCCSKYVRWFGNNEQRAQIAVTDAKIKKKKQKGKQMTKEVDATAKAACVNAGSQGTSHSESDAELGIVSEQQSPENTTPGQATSTQAAPVSRSLPPAVETVKDQTGNQYYNKELSVTQWSNHASSEDAMVFAPVTSPPPHIDHQVQSNALRARRTPPVLMTDNPRSKSVDAELVIARERQILEITTAGQATSTRAPASTSLPPGWETVKDQTGNEFYYNKELNVTQWSRPAPSGDVVYNSEGWA